MISVFQFAHSCLIEMLWWAFIVASIHFTFEGEMKRCVCDIPLLLAVAQEELSKEFKVG